jgi:predicted Zn-dependent protease
MNSPAPTRYRCRLCAGLSALCSADPDRRRWLGALAAGALGLAAPLPAPAQDGVARDVGKNSMFTKLVSAEQVEAAAAQQYAQLLKAAQQKGALGPPGHPQVVRLRAISQRLIPHAPPWNPRARQWRWEVNLIGSAQINAFCMPGGRIAFFSGILQQLQLDDDEVATIMGHEMAHALREHARERMAKNAATGLGLSLGAQLLGLGSAGDLAANIGTQLLTLVYSRGDETEADLVGMELAARSGYDPRAGISLWQKMAQAAKGAPPQWLSTHPSSDTRIDEIRANLPKVEPLFARAPRPPQRFEPMPRTAARPRTPGAEQSR